MSLSKNQFFVVLLLGFVLVVSVANFAAAA